MIYKYRVLEALGILDQLTYIFPMMEDNTEFSWLKEAVDHFLSSVLYFLQMANK